MLDDSSNDIAYQASSPGFLFSLNMSVNISLICIDRSLDEHALVTAVKEMGVVFFRRTPDSVIINFVS